MTAEGKVCYHSVFQRVSDAYSYGLLFFLGDAQYWGWEIDYGGEQDGKVWSCKTVMFN
jgi:hypothetical protein